MKPNERLLRTWRMVVAGHALLTTVLAWWLVPMLLDSATVASTQHPELALWIAVIPALSWMCLIGVAVGPLPGGTLSIVVGVLTLPAGAVLIASGIAVRALAKEAEGAPDSNCHETKTSLVHPSTADRAKTVLGVRCI